jgi:hypothetical protein
MHFIRLMEFLGHATRNKLLRRTGMPCIIPIIDMYDRMTSFKATLVQKMEQGFVMSLRESGLATCGRVPRPTRMGYRQRNPSQHE